MGAAAAIDALETEAIGGMKGVGTAAAIGATHAQSRARQDTFPRTARALLWKRFRLRISLSLSRCMGGALVINISLVIGAIEKGHFVLRFGNFGPNVGSLWV